MFAREGSLPFAANAREIAEPEESVNALAAAVIVE